jgi:hypothetical protein
MIKFCSECGVKIEYKFSPPKFCSSCGVSMGGTSTESQPLGNRSINSKKKSQVISDSETDAEFVPHLDKLEYEVETFSNQLDHTIGSLAGKHAMSKRKIVRKDLDDIRR